MTENKIPKHWEVKKVSSTGILIRGVNYKKDDAVNVQTVDYVPILRGNNINGELNFNDLVFVRKSNVSDEQMVLKGDIVIAMSSGSKHLVGKSAKLKSEFRGSFGAFCGVFRPYNEIVNKDFIAHFFQSPYYKNTISNVSKGSNINNLKREHILDLAIPIPPLPEQLAIVSKIEELLSDLENGKQQLLTAQQQLKVYRQSLLKAAFEGRLTHKDVKEGELLEGWKWVKIEEIASVGTGSTPLKGNDKYFKDGKIAWVTSGALNNEFVQEATDYVTELALKETNLSIYPKHTLLLAMYGEGKTRGKCSELLIESTTNQAIAAIHFKYHDIRVKPFLRYYLLKNYNDIRMLSSGGVQPNLNLGIVKKTLVPFPTLEEQHQIVEILESKLTICDKLAATINQSLQQAETLKQSILKKAFEGKLV